MNKRTSAPRDCPLGDTALRVNDSGKPVEVCWTEIALALIEAGIDALSKG